MGFEEKRTDSEQERRDTAIFGLVDSIDNDSELERGSERDESLRKRRKAVSTSGAKKWRIRRTKVTREAMWTRLEIFKVSGLDEDGPGSCTPEKLMGN